MNPSLRPKLVLSAAAVAMAIPGHVDAAGKILSLETGHSIVIPGQNIGRVAVGDGRIAGAVPLSGHEIVINAKSAGETTIFVWDGGVRRTYELTVTEHRLDQVARLLQRSLDNTSVQTQVLGESIIVSGKVTDLAAYEKINNTIATYKGLKFESGVVDPVVINTVSVERPLGNLAQEMASIPSARNLRVDLDSNGNIVVSGRVRDRQVEQDVLDRINGLAGPYLKTDGKVVDRLSTDAKSMVDIKVDVLEVDRTAQSALGLRLQTATETQVGNGTNFTLQSNPSVVALENPLKALTSGNPFTLGPFSRISLLAPTLDLLLQQGHARLLSSPNLVTKPGKLASFLVGGQIPVPVSNGLGTVSIDYKQFGVQLNVTPTIDADGGVESEITPEISDLDFADGIQINGFTVPAFKTSKLSTDVVTNDGESIVMGGLLRRIEQRNIQKFPILGDLPILGALFRSVSYQKTDTDVVFVMTPYIVTKHNLPSETSGASYPVTPPRIQVSRPPTPQFHDAPPPSASSAPGTPAPAAPSATSGANPKPTARPDQSNSRQ